MTHLGDDGTHIVPESVVGGASRSGFCWSMDTSCGPRIVLPSEPRWGWGVPCEFGDHKTGFGSSGANGTVSDAGGAAELEEAGRCDSEDKAVGATLEIADDATTDVGAAEDAPTLVAMAEEGAAEPKKELDGARADEDASDNALVAGMTVPASEGTAGAAYVVEPRKTARTTEAANFMVHCGAAGLRFALRCGGCRRPMEFGRSGRALLYV